MIQGKESNSEIKTNMRHGWGNADTQFTKALLQMSIINSQSRMGQDG